MSSQGEPESCRWQDLYAAAIVENEEAKLAERIAHAEWAIIVRWHGLSSQPEGALQERQALETAFDTLRVLKDDPRKTAAA